MNRKKVIVISTALILLLTLAYGSLYLWYYRASLRAENPPQAFRETDLVGTWKTDYQKYDWGRCGTNSSEVEQRRQARSLVEGIILREDKSFFQVLHDREGRISDQWAQGTWWVERFPDGVTWLHLKGGRFFAEEICESFPHLAPLTYFKSYGTIQSGHELSFNCQEEVVLIVAWDRFAKKLYLEYPFVGGDPDAPIIVKFSYVSKYEFRFFPTPDP